MKQTVTELVLILDRSGSMAGLEEDTMGGFNSMLQKQKQEEGQVLVSTLLFDHAVEVLHDRVPLQDVPSMGKGDYWVRGSTALLDALGGAIRHIETIHKYARPQDVPDKTVFVITTDGLENSSREFTPQQVRAMIHKAQETRGWEFLFLGANMDAVETAGRFGIREDRAVTYCPDGQGTALNYEAISDAVSQVRECCPLSASWKQDIEKDYKARHRK